MTFVLTLLASMSFANDLDVKQIDAGLFAAPSTGVAYLTTETEGGWYVEALDTRGELLLEKVVLGEDLSEADAVRIARAAQSAKNEVVEVQLESGAAKVTIAKGKLSVGR